MRLTVALLVSSSLLLGNSCDSPSVYDDEVGGDRAAIINGATETGYSQVVAVARTGASGASGGLCSGTVIGDYAVLTAKHCVFDEISSGVYRAVRASDFLVIVGYDLGSAAGIAWTSSVYEVRTTSGSNIDRDLSIGNDIAILLLPTRVPTDVPRAGYVTSGPSDGDPLTIVGFGRTVPGTPMETDSGVKYRGSTRVRGTDAGLIESYGAAWTCQGDSGGPAFDAAGSVTGITSFGPGGCTSPRSYYTRVSRHGFLIADALTFMPPCMMTLEVCDGVDNDCDGVVDPGCTALGDPCSASEMCSGGRCDSVGGASVCVRDCDPSTAVPRCPFGFWCEAMGCGMGRCVRGEPGVGADGDVCSAPLDCESTSCTPIAGMMRCGRQCTLAGEACPAGDVCETTAGATCGACVPVALATGPRSFGAPCDRSDQCVSMQCTSGFCTRPCDAMTPCPSAFHCRAGACVRGGLGGAGAECVTAEDCGSVAPDCVDADGERLCASSCIDSAGCMVGFECGPTDLGDHCVPPGAALGASCGAASDCRTGICAGICTRECSTTSPCPTGYDCRDGGGLFVCLPRASGGGGSRGGGCSVASQSSSTELACGLGLLGASAVVVVRSRRRRRRLP